MGKTGQSMPAGRLAAATGRHSMSAGKVTMAKTEHSTVAGRPTTPAGRVTTFTGKVTTPSGQAPLPVARVAIIVGRLPAFNTEAATGVGKLTISVGAVQLATAPSAAAFWLNTSLSPSTVTVIGSPSCSLPLRISSASGSSRNRSTERRIGRAPYCGS